MLSLFNCLCRLFPFRLRHQLNVGVRSLKALPELNFLLFTHPLLHLYVLNGTGTRCLRPVHLVLRQRSVRGGSLPLPSCPRHGTRLAVSLTSPRALIHRDEQMLQGKGFKGPVLGDVNTEASQ